MALSEVSARLLRHQSQLLNPIGKDLLKFQQPLLNKLKPDVFHRQEILNKELNTFKVHKAGRRFVSVSEQIKGKPSRKYIVVDNFTDCDPSGKNLSDRLPHGEWVVKAAQAVHPGILIEKCDIAVDGLHRTLSNILMRVLDGEKIAGINLSQGVFTERGSIAVESLLKSIERLAAQGIRVYIAAGNKFAKKVNVLGRANGASVIGALDQHGEQAAYTSSRNLVTHWTQGIFDILPVQAEGRLTGYSVFKHNGKMDVSLDEVNGWTEPVDPFNGIPASELEEKIAGERKRFDKLFMKYPMSGKDAPSIKMSGIFLPNEHGQRTFFSSEGKQYIIDEDGNLKLLKDSKHPQAVGIISGTSFAAPTQMAMDALKCEFISHSAA